MSPYKSWGTITGIGRITDGIYRQPASALRELITNAYDADATNVYVETDWPRFSRISVRDDGTWGDDKQHGDRESREYSSRELHRVEIHLSVE